VTHTSSPSKPKTISSALRHQCRYVIQFKIIIILITTFHSVRVTDKPQSVSNAAYNFFGTHCSYSAILVLGIERHNRLDWTAFSGSLVSPFSDCQIFFYFDISSAAFSTAALHQRPLNTQHCIYMSLQKLITHYCAQHAYSQLTFRRQWPSIHHR